MIRLTTLLLASVAGIGSAAGQQVYSPLYDPKPIRTTGEALEKLTGWPAGTVLPLPQDRAADLGRLTTVKPSKHVIYSEPGGRIDEHALRFKGWAALGGEVEIRGMCQSACTMLLSYIPRERICFSRYGFLNFHKASNADHTPSM